MQDQHIDEDVSAADVEVDERQLEVAARLAVAAPAARRDDMPAIAFQNLGYRVCRHKWQRSGCALRRATKEKVILEGATGSLYYGELVALMGGSGAGKSSLLDLLALRKDAGNVLGDVLYEGRTRRRLLSSDAAYVMQEDMAMPNLTVFETLMFAAKFRLNNSYEEKAAIVNGLLKELRLEHTANTRVGSSLDRGISGGEFRRLTIAESLLTSPRMIFLDEPTSGLDSASAMVVVSLLKRLTQRRNQLIVVSIHQPSPALLELFDKVVILVRSPVDRVGRVAYIGPVAALNDYPPSVGVDVPPEFQHNVAELIMEITTRQNIDNQVDAALLAGGDQDGDSDGKQVWQCPQIDLATAWSGSAMGVAMRERTIAHMQQAEQHRPADVNEQRTYPTSRLNQLAVFGHRLMLNTTRQQGFLVSRFAQPHIVGFFIASLYARIGTSDQDIQNVVSLTFFSLLVCFLMAQVFLPAFIVLRPLTSRERRSKLYSAMAMVFGTVLPNMPIELFNFVTFSTYVYWIVGLRIDGYYWFCWLVNFVGNGCLLSFFIMFCSSVSATPEVALAIAPIMFMFFIMFCGFFVLIETIPVWFRYWAPYLSPIRYALAVGLYTQFSGVDYGNCTDCRFNTGDEVLDFYGVPINNDGEMWGYIVIVYSFAFAFLVGVYLANRFRKWHRG